MSLILFYRVVWATGTRHAVSDLPKRDDLGMIILIGCPCSPQLTRIFQSDQRRFFETCQHHGLTTDASVLVCKCAAYSRQMMVGNGRGWYEALFQKYCRNILRYY
jgi:hypothetical protein